MDMAVEARYSHVPLTAKERGLFLVNAHFLPTTKKLIIIRNTRQGRPRNGCGVHHVESGGAYSALKTPNVSTVELIS